MKHPSSRALDRRQFLAHSAAVAGAAAGAGSLLALGQSGRARASEARDTTTLTIMFAQSDFPDAPGEGF